jgi:TRAP-type transport system small permease protein
MVTTGPSSWSDSVLGRLVRLGLNVSIGLLLLISALVVTQILARNLFNVGWFWADELARFSGIALVYLSVPYLLYRGQHISVDLIAARLTGRLRQVSQIVNELVVIFFCAVTLYGFYSFLMRAARFSTPALGIPNLYYYLPALIGILLLAAISIHRLWLAMRGRELVDRPGLGP